MKKQLEKLAVYLTAQVLLTSALAFSTTIQDVDDSVLTESDDVYYVAACDGIPPKVLAELT